jgi:hypothetical protein
MPDAIKNIIPGVMGRLSAGNPEWQNSLTRSWQAAIDKKAQKHTAIAGFKNGKLLINVDSPVWLFQLNLRRPQMLKSLQRDFPELAAISFRIGKVD